MKLSPDPVRGDRDVPGTVAARAVARRPFRSCSADAAVVERSAETLRREPISTSLKPRRHPLLVIARILFVANPASIHTARWISQLDGVGWDVRVLGSAPTVVNDALKGATVYGFSGYSVRHVSARAPG